MKVSSFLVFLIYLVECGASSFASVESLGGDETEARPKPALRILDYRNIEDLRVLRTPSKPVRDFYSPGFLDSARSLVETFTSLPSGAGLAAKQLGLEEDMFLLSPTRKTSDWFLFANVTIHPIEDGGTFKTWQGCFSCPLALVKVDIPNKIILDFYTIMGRPVTVEVVNKFLISILYHEKGHNLGRIITDIIDSEIRIFKTREEYMDELTIIKEQDKAILGAGEEAAGILRALFHDDETGSCLSF